MYGTTSAGGAFDYGTIYKIAPDGRVTTIYEFSGPDGARPLAGLTQASDGSLYGTTAEGGSTFRDVSSTGGGTVFRLDTAGNLVTLYNFGTPDSGDPASPGSFPESKLLDARDGNLYGTTTGGFGCVFKLSKAGVLEVVARVADTFHRSNGDLIQATDGSIFGTVAPRYPTYSAWVYRVDPAGLVTTTYQWRYPMASYSTGLIQAWNGSLYGMTVGTVFRLDPSGTLVTLHTFVDSEGTQPAANLLQASDGALYGTTAAGGTADYGTIFRIDTSGAFTTLHDFGTGQNGAFPTGIIEGVEGVFYGTTRDGGFGAGTVFRLDSTGASGTLHRFTGQARDGGDGATPGPLRRGSDGWLYGTTQDFGPFNFGTVFRMSTGGELTTLHAFTGYDTGPPTGGVLEASNGSFYGQTWNTVFKLEPSGSFITLHTFDALAGGVGYPQRLIQGHDGHLYGVTAGGGFGGIFKLGLNGGLTTVHEFTGTDGGLPLATLTQARDGRLYGTTSVGGAGFSELSSGYGTVFRLDTSGTLVTLHSFTNADGAHPQGGLVETPDGLLYGVTSEGGAFGYGTIFAIDPVGSFRLVHSFSLIDGAYAGGDLILASDGRIYGTAPEGGPDGGGVVFRLTLDARPAHPVPGVIEAEDYDHGGPGIGYVDRTRGNVGGAYRSDDVDIKPSREGGFAVGWFMSGEWLAYTTTVRTAGRYTIRARVGSALPGRTLRVEIDGRDVTGPLAVPQVSDWDRYKTVSGPTIALTAGTHVLRVAMGPQDYADFQWLEFVAARRGRPVPAIIEAEDYDAGGPGVGYMDATVGNIGGAYRRGDVDIKVSSQGGFAVGWFVTGEWLAYTVHVPTTGAYTLTARVGSALAERSFRITVDGIDVTGLKAVPQTANWDQYGNVSSSVQLQAGTHVLRFVPASDWIDFQWLDVTRP